MFFPGGFRISIFLSIFNTIDFASIFVGGFKEPFPYSIQQLLLFKFPLQTLVYAFYSYHWYKLPL